MNDKKFFDIIKKYIKNQKFEKKTILKKVKKWDSLTHLNILFTIEKVYKIKFNINEINNFKSVGEIIDCVKNKK
jgi:acyl carrier protein|tara:strand:- start:446 stop:667 length:222 start_codon:yes stop_codon:yes gene_type:complete